MNIRSAFVIAITMVVSVLSSMSFAESTAADPEARMRALEELVQKQALMLQEAQAQIADLKTDRDGTWLNAARAEQVKSIVKSMLQDADTRASLLGDDWAAGYGKHFFLASPDGSFHMDISGMSQIRYIINATDESEDDFETGFHLARTKLGFSGHVGGEMKMIYDVRMALNDNDNTVFLDRAYVGVHLTDEVFIGFGLMKPLYNYEEMVPAEHQQFIERSLINERFSIGRTVGANLQYLPSNIPLEWYFSANNGKNNSEQGRSTKWNDTDDDDDFDDDVDFALTSRLSYRIAGERPDPANAYRSSFSSWSTDSFSAALGAAVHYQRSETGDTRDNNELLGYGVDLKIADANWNAFVGYYREEYCPDPDSGDPMSNAWGIVAQAGMFVIPDKLELAVRYEHLDLDGGLQGGLEKDTINIFTLGANYHLSPNIKFSADFSYIADPLPSAEQLGVSTWQTSLLGLQESGDDQFVTRFQLQLMF